MAQNEKSISISSKIYCSIIGLDINENLENRSIELMIIIFLLSNQSKK